jgi:MFS family permease
VTGVVDRGSTRAVAREEPDTGDRARDPGAFGLPRFLVICFFTGAALGMTAPITVLFALSFGVSDGLGGLTWATIAIGLALVDVFGTKVVPRLDGRVTMWLSLSVFSVGLLISGLAPSLAVMIAGRVVQGAGAAIVMGGALQVVVRFTPPERTGRAIGAFNAAWFAGISMGPLVGGLLSEIGEGQQGFRIAFAVSAATSLVVALAARLVLPSIPSGRTPRVSLPRRPRPRAGFRVWPPLALGTFSEASRGALVFTLIPLFGTYRLGLSTGTIGVALSALAVVDITSMRFGGMLADRVGRRPVFAGALAIGALACLMAPFVVNLGLFIGWCAVLGVPVALAWVIPAAMIVDVSAEREAGLAAYRISADAGVASGSTVAGVAAGAVGPAGAIVGMGGVLAVMATWIWRLPEARARSDQLTGHAPHDERPLVLPVD